MGNSNQKKEENRQISIMTTTISTAFKKIKDLETQQNEQNQLLKQKVESLEKEIELLNQRNQTLKQKIESLEKEKMFKKHKSILGFK